MKVSETPTNINKSVISDNIYRNSGWQWVIAISCFWINAFIFGVFRSAGVLYLAFVTTFGCTYQVASWPISLAGSIASITGIAAGFLNHYFYIRTLVFLGVFISSLAISVSYFAKNIIFIIISLGIIQGVGIGLVTNLLPAIISQYFGKQRAIACGISYAGATVGAFIFPLFIEWQLKEYGLRGTLLLMGGITLHGLIGALLLRPIKFDFEEKANKKSTNFENSINNEPLIDECETVVFLEKNNHQYSNISKFRERPKSMIDFDNPVVKLRDQSSNDRNRAKRMSLPVFHERKAINYLNQSYLNRRLSIIPKDSIKLKPTLWRSITRHVREDVKIFLNLHFVLCTITYICFIIDFVVFLIILPDFAGDQGLSGPEGTFLLSLYSITDLFGRIIPGWISYLGFLTNKNIYITSIAVMGICFFLMPMANSFTIFAVLTLICGFVTGCQMVLPAVVLSEYLGADKTAVAFGLSNFLCGIITIIFRPLMIGIKDGTGHYDTLFYILGALAIGSALLWLLDLAKIHILKFCKNR